MSNPLGPLSCCSSKIAASSSSFIKCNISSLGPSLVLEVVRRLEEEEEEEEEEK